MERIGIAGLSYRTASLKLLERLTASSGEGSELVLALRRACGVPELAYLSTCNRIEILYVRSDDVTDGELVNRILEFFGVSTGDPVRTELEQRMYLYHGVDAVTHLFRVAASLDSMVVGETDILRQVKRAHETARDSGTIGPILHATFEQAIKVAKRVHTETQLTARPLSMVSLATGLIHEQLAGAGAGARVVLVGAGEMTVKAATYLQSRGHVSLVFVNRTLERAEALAERFGGEARTIDAFLEAPGEVAVLLSATSAPSPLFNVSRLASLLEPRPDSRPLLVIDLALPRDCDIDLDKHPNVRLFDLESLGRIAALNQAARATEITRAVPLIQHQVKVLRRRLIEAGVGPAVARLQRASIKTAGEELERLLQRELTHLSESDKEILRRFADRFGRRAVQIPIVSLKEMAVACECGAAAGALRQTDEGAPLQSGASVRDWRGVHPEGAIS